MSEDVMQVNGKSLVLKRPGEDGAEARGLRAWDAADEQLAKQAFRVADASGRNGLRVLIIDDQFGALTLGLADLAPTSIADSYALVSALRLNSPALAAESGELPALNWLCPPETSFDIVVMRIPRQLDYLGWLLRWVNQVLKPGGSLIAGGMIKHLPDRSAELFGELVRTESVCPARKKARVIVARPGDATLEGWGSQWKGYDLPGSQCPISALPAVFSREKLDIGTRQLLPFVRSAAATLRSDSRVLDLACGNGVLGLAALDSQPGLNVTFSDVSSQAVASACRNTKESFPDASVTFEHGDGVPETGSDYDLILLNPPFHEGGVVGDHIALRLFRQSAAKLAPNGRLLMVGNRHLGYHRSLRRFFGQVTQLAADPKFVVFEASGQSAGRS